MKGILIASVSAKHETYLDDMRFRPGGDGFISKAIRNFFSWMPILICLTAAFGSVGAEESQSRTVSEGDLITYYYNVSNIGNVNLTQVKVIDDRVDPIYISGDTNNDSWLNLSEIWLYKAVYRVTKFDLKKDIINIAVLNNAF